MSEVRNVSYPPRLGYNPSLDGLRGIAIIFVMMAHANFQLGIYGAIGVDMFFVLSGFLITTLLLEENLNRKLISLKAFFIRRVFRLFPALCFLLMVILLYSLFQYQNIRIIILKDVLWSIFYVKNISWLWETSNSGLLNHMWSLAVEEQFYLFWPFLLISLIKKNMLQSLNIILPLFSVYIFISHMFGISWIFNSIFHEGIFLGCSLALFRWNNAVLIKHPSSISIFLIMLIIIIGVAPIKYDVNLENVFGLITSIITSFLILISVEYKNHLLIDYLLNNSILVFIGKISYALYIWHIPVFFWFREHSSLDPLENFILKWIVTLLLSLFSWYVIEKPFLKFGRSLSDKIKNSLITCTI
jgi:peptidoglycan/LPS O-acetylase OafA/YrhL